MKITKQFLKQIIREELDKLSQSAESALDDSTAEEFNIPPTDKNNIKAIQAIMAQIRAIRAKPGTTDADTQGIIARAPPNIQDLFKNKYGNNYKDIDNKH